MKRLVINLLIGVLIGLVALCVTTEIMGFVYINEGLPEFIETSLFTGLARKLVLSISAGLLIGIYLYIEASDISHWKKVIAYTSSIAIVIFFMALMKNFATMADNINFAVYSAISLAICMLYFAIKDFLLKKDIKKINEKLNK